MEEKEKKILVKPRGEALLSKLETSHQIQSNRHGYKRSKRTSNYTNNQNEQENTLEKIFSKYDIIRPTKSQHLYFTEHLQSDIKGLKLQQKTEPMT